MNIDSLKMGFNFIDIENWNRREHYLHYMNNVPCGYFFTVELVIEKIKNERLYPAMLWLLTAAVNEFIEFRSALAKDGRLGYFDSMNPTYTIFNPEQKTFSSIWTEFNSDYSKFLVAYQKDTDLYKTSTGMTPKPDCPDNVFNVSMIPWLKFSSFNLNIWKGDNYLLPIFTLGKKYTEKGVLKLPLAVQVHHAVCDGYHAGCFIEALQEKINNWLGTN